MNAKLKKNTSTNSNAVKAGLNYTIGNMFIKGISFIAIPIFSRLMTQADYGLYNTFISYASILTMFVGLTLHTSIKNAKYDFPDQLNRYCSSLLLLILANTLLISVISVIFSKQLGALAALGGGMALLMVAESFGNALLNFYNAALAMEFRYKEYLFISFAYSLGSILLSVFFIEVAIPQNGYLARALGSVVPLLLISVYIILRFFHSSLPCVSKTYWKYGLKFSLPLIPHGLSQIVLSQFDRIMITNTIGEAQAGIYSFAFNISIIYQVLYNSVDTAWTPWFYSQMSEGKEDNIKKNTAIYVIFMSVAACLLMLVCPEIILIMGGKKYIESRYTVIPIVLGMYFAFLYSLPAVIEYFYKKTKLIAVGTAGAALANVVLNAIFIPMYGYVAAAYTTVVCYVLYFFFHLFIAKKILGRFLYDMKSLFACIAGVVVFTAACLAMLDYMWLRWGILLVFLLASGIIALRKKEQLITIVKQMLGRE